MIPTLAAFARVACGEERHEVRHACSLGWGEARHLGAERAPDAELGKFVREPPWLDPPERREELDERDAVASDARRRSAGVGLARDGLDGSSLAATYPGSREGFNNPNHAARRYSWIKPPSTSLRSTVVRGVPRSWAGRMPAGSG